MINTEGLLPFLASDCGIQSAVVMATSGSTGESKFAVLSKRALLHSAGAVIRHCELEKADVWLSSLSDFHVGGLGIYARAYVAGGKVEELLPGKWDRSGRRLVEACQASGASLTSMTPTHLHDLVVGSVKAPLGLRGVFLGGGRIDLALVERAIELGWPIWPSYGMTEACSQIATSTDGESEWLPVLEEWECQISPEGRLAIRGDALFSGYASKQSGEWRFQPALDEDGWFETGDRCELNDGRLRFLDRADDVVKISGELISLSRVNDIAERAAVEFGAEAQVVAVPDARRENSLVMIGSVLQGRATLLLDQVNAELDSIEKVDRVLVVEELPRTEIGKLDRAKLLQLAMGQACD
tara:strand:+ start:439 stop:1503 length:1065 start_codon:yes stop_codon:yes gene_type:complete